MGRDCAFSRNRRQFARTFTPLSSHYIHEAIAKDILTLYSRVTGEFLGVGDIDCIWNVMAHSQKPHFVFAAKRTSLFKSAGGRNFSCLLAAELSASELVILDTPCSEVVWRVLATHSIRQFPSHFLSSASTSAITFQPGSATPTVVTQYIRLSVNPTAPLRKFQHS